MIRNLLLASASPWRYNPLPRFGHFAVFQQRIPQFTDVQSRQSASLRFEDAWLPPASGSFVKSDAHERTENTRSSDYFLSYTLSSSRESEPSSHYTQTLYDRRYLSSSCLNGESTRGGNELDPALQSCDTDSAWEAWKLRAGFSDRSLENQLWWQIAAQADCIRRKKAFERGIPERDLAKCVLGRLLELSASLGVETLSRLQKHRLLYLLIVDLETAQREFKISNGRPKRPGLALPHVDPKTWQAVNHLIDTSHKERDIIDSPLLVRLVHQLAVHGRPTDGLTLLDEHISLWRKGKFDVRFQEGWANSRPRLNAHAAEPLLESIALEPLRRRHVTKMSHNQEEGHESDVGDSTLSNALRVISMALEDEIALHKRPLSAWMQHISIDVLWSLLPKSLARAARSRPERWAVGCKDATDTSLNPPYPIDDNLRHFLCHIVAYHLALRGDLRVCLTLYDFDRGRTQGSPDPHIFEALVVGTTKVIYALSSSQSGALDRRRDGNIADDVLHAFSFVLSLASMQSMAAGSQASDALLQTIDVMRPHLRALRDSEGKASTDLWLPTVRQMTARILDGHHRLDHISPRAHQSLLRFHATLEDYDVTKELYIRLRARQARAQLQSGSAERVQLLPSRELKWFLAQTVSRDTADDANFALRIYLDSYAGVFKTDQEALPPRLLIMLLRCLHRHRLLHEFRTVLDDMRAKSSLMTPKLARVLVEAFRQTDAQSLAQNLESTAKLVEIFQRQAPSLGLTTQPEAQRGRGVSVPLEIYSTTLFQGTSQWLAASWWTFRPRLVAAFESLIALLDLQIKHRAAMPLAKVSGTTTSTRIAEETVRQAINSAIRIQLDFPTLSLFRPVATAAEELDCLLGSQSSLEVRAAGNKTRSICEDLLLSPRPTNTPQTASDRRSYIAHMIDVLEHRLGIGADSETWSLKLLGWLLPLSVEEARDGITRERLRAEAVKVWKASRCAEYDFDRSALLKPWARLTEGIEEREKTQTSEELSQEAVLGSSLADTRPDLRRSPWWSGPTRDGAVDDLSASQARTSAPVVHHSRGAALRPIRLRSRITARFMLCLALEAGEFELAEHVYHSWLNSVEREEDFARQQAQMGRVSAKAKMQQRRKEREAVWRPSIVGITSTGTARASLEQLTRLTTDKYAIVSPVGRRSVELAYLVILTLQGRDDEAIEVWQRLSAKDRLSLSSDRARRPSSTDGVFAEDWTVAHRHIVAAAMESAGGSPHLCELAKSRFLN